MCSPWPIPSSFSHLCSFADYQTLRIGGLVFAVVLFSLGILLILSESFWFLAHSVRAVSAAAKRVEKGVRAWLCSLPERAGASLCCLLSR